MNSVQFLRGQLRPVLMVMALGAAHAAVAAEEMKLTPLSQVPLGIEVRGKQVAAYSWDDRQGRNLLVLAEQEAGERDDDGTQSASIYAAQYLLEGIAPSACGCCMTMCSAANSTPACTLITPRPASPTCWVTA